MTIRSVVLAIASLLSFSAAPAAALVFNGGFEQTTNGPGQIGTTQAVGWQSGGYNFIFDSTNADSWGSPGPDGRLRLWGPATGYDNGLGASLDGGYFFGADGAYLQAPISQMIEGLTVGAQYDLKFYWAGAQQAGYEGRNNERWAVSFGNDTKLTDWYHNDTGGFSGWFTEVFRFTATSPTQILSFLAHGTPDGVPPFSLLDGVTLTEQVPEAPTAAIMLFGLGLVGLQARRRRKAA